MITESENKIKLISGQHLDQTSGFEKKIWNITINNYSAHYTTSFFGPIWVILYFYLDFSPINDSEQEQIFLPPTTKHLYSFEYTMWMFKKHKGI